MTLSRRSLIGAALAAPVAAASKSQAVASGVMQVTIRCPPGIEASVRFLKVADLERELVAYIEVAFVAFTVER